ncbi:ion channel [Vibrio diabolicus]|uniref:potassium channel family protein n=1 Tax=Vibrio diabolicus TaxID=50719 RepID=UPI00215E2772|nr:potassium channel family protein [Vibrio diabolicus]MCS0305192.1 ion channel [Vibrio diabolicus]
MTIESLKTKTVGILYWLGLKIRGSTSTFWANIKRLFFISVALLPVYLVSMYHLSDYEKSSTLVICLSISSLYVYLLNFLYRNLEVESKQFWQIPCFFVFVMFFLSIMFMPLIVEVSDAFNDGNVKNAFDAIYFGIISLTSVGYGDIHPINTVGKIISITMSVLGSIHTIMFIALVIDRITDNRN